MVVGGVAGCFALHLPVLEDGCFYNCFSGCVEWLIVELRGGRWHGSIGGVANLRLVLLAGKRYLVLLPFVVGEGGNGYGVGWTVVVNVATL